METAITIHYPIGGESTLNGQTRQDLSTSLYRLLGNGTLVKVAQEYKPVKTEDGKVSFQHGAYILTITPTLGVQIERVQGLVEEFLLFHPGATIQP